MTVLRLTAVGLVLILAALLLASCRTKHVGTQPPPQVSVDAQVTFVADTTWNPVETATLTVTWSGGTPPYTVACDMGGGTTEDIPAGTPAVSPFTHQFVLVEGDWTYTVAITDADGVSATVTGDYQVWPGFGPDPPSIDSVVYDQTYRSLTVMVSDPDDGLVLTVTVTEPPGLVVDATSKVVQQTSGTAVFIWSAADIIAGGTGDTTITVSDDRGAQSSTSATITVGPLWVAEGDLITVPLETAVKTDEPVTIVVLTGDFPSGASFCYLNSVAVTIEEGAQYVPGSLNVGLPGGDQKDSDGLWASMSPIPATFLLPDDSMIFPIPVDGDWGRVFFGFSVTPVGGGDVTGGGALLNFQLTFDIEGTYNHALLEFQEVKRTYYSDADGNEHYWVGAPRNPIPWMPIEVWD